MLTANPGATHAQKLWVGGLDNKIRVYDAFTNTLTQTITNHTSGVQGLAFDSAGYCYASTGATISKFDSSGNFVSSFLGNGSGEVTIKNNILYVAGYGASTIGSYTLDGTFLRNYGDATHVNNGQGVTADSSGNVYITSGNDNAIRKYSSTGAYLSSFGNSSNLNSPDSITIDSNGNFYVGNYFRTTSKFDSNGNFLSSIGSSDGKVGLAFDDSGNLYVGNQGSNVSVFNPSGAQIKTIASGSQPQYIAIAPTITTVNATPEPGAYATLAGICTTGLCALSRRRKRTTR